MPFILSQQPDGSMGRRYSKAFKYVFVMLKPGEDLTSVDPSDKPSAATSLIDDGRFVVLSLPRELQLREPYATVVTVMQDGGKVVESRGQVIRQGTISGTTGFVPQDASIPRGPLGAAVALAGDIDGHLGAISGYLSFQKLRYLFRHYGDVRRQGNPEGHRLYFFDYKNDDFWWIEPESFDMQRSSRRPMTYDYNISFKCLEHADPVTRVSSESAGGFGYGFGNPLDTTYQAGNAAALLSGVYLRSGADGGSAGGVLAKVANASGAAMKSPILVTVGRFADMVTSGLDFLKFCDAVVQRTFQDTLNKLDAVVGFFANIHDTFFTLLEVVPVLMAQLSSSLAGLFRTIDEFAPDNIAQELNAWALEVTVLSDHMSAQVGLIVASQAQRDVSDTDQRFSLGRFKAGATTDLMQEPSGGSGALDANPFIGTSGLSLVTDVDSLTGAAQRVAIAINYGEDIYALARRVFGRIERFIDLVLINQLEFPFIVADANRKPPNTLAWGEYILVPSTGAISVIADSGGAAAIPTKAGVIDTASLPSQIIDSTARWLVDQWVGYSVTVVTGGLRQTLICSSNTDTVVTLDGNLTISVVPGTTTYTITYAQFNPRRPLTAEARAYGTDFLAVFGSDGRCDATIGANGDVAVAQGFDNFFQAITLRARCPLGEHPFHKTYGMPVPTGRPVNDNVGVLYSLFMRRSLLSDPRVGKVRNVQLDLSGDVLTMSAEAQPVDARTASPITVRVGA